MRHPLPLDVLFAPASVAVIGASDKPRSVGRTILRNLLAAAPREQNSVPHKPVLSPDSIYPVHPAQSEIAGLRAYPRLADLPAPVDLAVIATPASTVPELVRECVETDVKSAIIISAGFREIRGEGIERERQIREIIHGTPLRILGPNSLGILRPASGLNATFAATMPRAGDIAFISQSGALGTAVLDWSIRENFGFSAFLSVGSMLDIGWSELIDYLGADDATKSIVLYMETMGDARSFLSAARSVALDKPIIVLKAGRSPQGAHAALLHTGATPAGDPVIEAALRRAGALRVESVADLFEIAQVLALQPRPSGPRLAIVTNAGGAGVLAADALAAHGGTLADLSNETLARLDGALSPHWSHSNPVDMLGDAGPEEYAQAVEIISQDAGTDGMLVILTPQAMSDPTGSAQAIKPFAQIRTKPVLAAWMGGAEVEVGANILRSASIPVFQYPDRAVRMFSYLVRYMENLRALYETPAPLAHEPDGASDGVGCIEQARADGRTILTEEESRQVLCAYNIPFVETHLATTAKQASEISTALGYPVVMKINSDKLVRKSEYGGVILNISSARNVQTTFRAVKNTVTRILGAPEFQGVHLQPMLDLKHSYALHIGSIADPQFGPILRFGAEKRPAHADDRGIPITADATPALMEDARYLDDALALPPLTTTLARRMMETTRMYRVLSAAGVDLSELEQILARFSTLVVEQPRIKAVEIHPLVVIPPFEDGAATQVFALDARIILHDPSVADADLPRPAIRPYPSQYVTPFTMHDGTPVIIRPIRPDDETLLVRLHEQLSEQSVYLRYFHALNLSERIAHERLSRVASMDYDRQLALVIEQTVPGQNGDASGRELLAITRLTRRPGTQDGEFAVLIRDDCQRQGLGTALVSKLIEVARAEGIKRLVGEILPENAGMKRLAEKLGFTLNYDFEAGVTRAELVL